MPCMLSFGRTIDAGITSAVLFYLFAGLSGVSALGVVLSRDIVRTAVFLLFTLIGVAGLYFLLESEFLAAVQLVVYVGGTLILIVFGVMLTSRWSPGQVAARWGEVVIAMATGMVLFAALVTAIHSGGFQPQVLDTSPKYSVMALGQALLGDYLVPFELASVVLLAVMIGAAYLARGRRRDEKQVARGATARRTEM
jgi:NADH:ubiquinone oxidoreductase subunit 6 (subunit J)